MSLIKTECRCSACNTPFIVVTPEEFNTPVYCPFCAMPIDEESDEEE